MKPAKEAKSLSILRKFMILTVLCLACGVFFIDDNVADASGGACYSAYDSCHTACDVPRPNDPNWNAAAIASCHSSCMGPYGNCVNQAQLDKEGQIIAGYEYGQPMPILQDLHTCLNSCPTCLVTDYPNDPEGMQACLETRLSCKISCIDGY